MAWWLISPKQKFKTMKSGLRLSFPMLSPGKAKPDDAHWSGGSEGFFKGFTIKEQSDFELLALYFQCPATRILICEGEEPSRIPFLREGAVNISMSSSDGRRLFLGVAGAGETLGLASAISGNGSEIQAEARYPCRIASLQRKDILELLLHHPVASQNASRELCLHYAGACERLRILGLTTSATARLAYLLLEWCKAGQQTSAGIQIRCALTHGDIGDYIGAPRETVARTLTDFRSHDLMSLCGSTLIVMSRSALAAYAGTDSIPGPHGPAA
jgi:CRP/FNR family transcriptional regulator, cyclic AMP receptor protein